MPGKIIAVILSGGKRTLLPLATCQLTMSQELVLGESLWWMTWALVDSPAALTHGLTWTLTTLASIGRNYWMPWAEECRDGITWRPVRTCAIYSYLVYMYARMMSNQTAQTDSTRFSLICSTVDNTCRVATAGEEVATKSNGLLWSNTWRVTSRFTSGGTVHYKSTLLKWPSTLGTHL